VLLLLEGWRRGKVDVSELRVESPVGNWEAVSQVGGGVDTSEAGGESGMGAGA
jgi:hypothetical protein